MTKTKDGKEWTQTSSEQASSEKAEVEGERAVDTTSVSASDGWHDSAFWVWYKQAALWPSASFQPLWMDIQFVYRALYLKVHHLHCKSMSSPGEQAERAETLSYARVLEPQRKSPFLQKPTQLTELTSLPLELELHELPRAQFPGLLDGTLVPWEAFKFHIPSTFRSPHSMPSSRQQTWLVASADQGETACAPHWYHGSVKG